MGATAADPDLLAVVAAYGLAGAPGLPGEPLDDIAFADLLARTEREGIGGLLAAAVTQGALPVTDPQRTRIGATVEGWRVHRERVEAVLLDAVDVLERSGIRSIVLKGVAAAHVWYPDPGMRTFGDVDLLVGAGDFTRAADLLGAELGFFRAEPELRPGFDDRFGKEILLRGPGADLDLHRMFVDGRYGLTMVLDDLWADPGAFMLGRRRLLVLAPRYAALHAAYSAVLGDWPPRFGPLRDLAQILDTTEVTVDDLRDAARRWQAEAVVLAALERMGAVLPCRVAKELPTGPPSLTPDDVRELDAYRGPDRGYTRRVRGARAVHGVRNRLRYLTALAWPSRYYLAGRGATRLGFARSAWGRYRGGGRREPEPAAGRPGS